jgi:hypothetical protein
MLEIRPPKATRVTTEDTEMENCLGKAKFASAEGYTGTWAQQTKGIDHKSAFLSLMRRGSCPLY